MRYSPDKVAFESAKVTSHELLRVDDLALLDKKAVETKNLSQRKRKGLGTHGSVVRDPAGHSISKGARREPTTSSQTITSKTTHC